MRRDAAAASRRAEFGQLGFDVHGDDAEEVDVLAVRRGDVGQELSGMAAVPEAPHALSITHPQAVNEAIEPGGLSREPQGSCKA